MHELGALQKLQIVAIPTILFAFVYVIGLTLMCKRMTGGGGSSARWGLSGFATLLIGSLLSMAAGYARLSVPRISPGGTPREMPWELALAGYFSLGSWVVTLVGTALIVRALWVADRRPSAV